MKKLNKKGNIPVTILVLGIFAICGFALLTFFISDFDVSNSFGGIGLLEKVNSHADEYVFYKNQGISQERLDSYFNLTTEGTNKVMELEERSSGLFSGNNFVFSVKYSFRK